MSNAATDLLLPRPLLAMHAPDGLFSLPVNLVFALAVGLTVWAASAALSRRRDHRLVPLMGVMAAFIFAGQMVNFPVAAGTTGHFLGGTLAAVLLGPWGGTLVMATVVFFQALLGDGGVTALGPNIFNMGVVCAGLGYLMFRVVIGEALGRPARVVAASFFAAWLATVLASAFVSLQLAVSGTVSLNRALPVMVGAHMLIGVGEALVTALVIAFVLKTRPDLLAGCRRSAARPLGRTVPLVGLGAALFVALVLSLLPALWPFPDALESIAAGRGTPPRIALLPDYTVPGLSGLISTSAAGGIGTIAMFLVSLAVGRVLVRPGRLARAAAAETTGA